MGAFSTKNKTKKISNKTHRLFCSKFIIPKGAGASTILSFDIETVEVGDIINLEYDKWQSVKSIDGKEYSFLRKSKDEGCFCCDETLVMAGGKPVGPQHEFKILLK